MSSASSFLHLLYVFQKRNATGCQASPETMGTPDRSSRFELAILIYLSVLYSALSLWALLKAHQFHIQQDLTEFAVAIALLVFLLIQVLLHIFAICRRRRNIEQKQEATQESRSARVVSLWCSLALLLLAMDIMLAARLVMWQHEFRAKHNRADSTYLMCCLITLCIDAFSRLINIVVLMSCFCIRKSMAQRYMTS